MRGLVLRAYINTVSGTVFGERKVRVLLPHEVIDCLAKAGCPSAFDSMMLGHLNTASREKFWCHVQHLDPWKNHPIFERMEGGTMGDVIPIAVHGDGAVMKRDDECFVWSFSSFFGSLGQIRDVLLFKFPFAIVHERHMRSPNETWQLGVVFDLDHPSILVCPPNIV